jgi:hypothetical protein
MLLTLATGFESSKVPFYILGGASALWAVGLSYVGLSRPKFPGGERGARVVMLIAFALMLGTMVTAATTG